MGRTKDKRLRARSKREPSQVTQNSYGQRRLCPDPVIRQQAYAIEEKMLRSGGTQAAYEQYLIELAALGVENDERSGLYRQIKGVPPLSEVRRRAGLLGVAARWGRAKHGLPTQYEERGGRAATK